jgi:Transposase DDE domain group 1
VAVDKISLSASELRKHGRVAPGSLADPRRRIRQAKASGLRNSPCRGHEQNNAWLQAVLASAGLVCWAKLICFAHVPSLARCEIAAVRYRVLHAAAQLTRSAHQLHLKIDRTWRWAAQIAEGFRRLRAALA